MKRLFLCNPESGEPKAYSGDIPEWEKFMYPLADFVRAEVEDMLENGDRSVTIEISVKEMTDDEVAALPDM